MWYHTHGGLRGDVRVIGASQGRRENGALRVGYICGWKEGSSGRCGGVRGGEPERRARGGDETIGKGILPPRKFL